MTAIDPQRLLLELGAISDELRLDPLFADATVEELRGYLSKSSGTVEHLFGSALQGMSEAYRYGGLRVVSAALGSKGAQDFGAPMAPEDVRVIVGSATVDGNLRLPDNAMLVVTGDLEISGNLVEDGAYYTMVAVAGRLTAKRVLVSGEMLCGEVVVEDYITFGNDYAGRIGRLRTKRYISDDHHDQVVERAIETTIFGHPLPRASELFPAEVLERDESESPPVDYVRWDRLAKYLLDRASRA